MSEVEGIQAKSRKKRVLAGASAETFLSITNILVGIAVIPIYFHYIASEEYGYWLVLNGLFSILGVADFGILVWLTREVANPKVVDNKDTLNSRYSTALLLQILIGALLFTVGMLMADQIIAWLKVPSVYLSEFRITYALGLLAFSLRLPLSVFSAVLNGHQRMALVNTVNGLALIGVSTLPIPLLASGSGMTSFALALLTAPLFSALYLCRMMKRAFPNLQLVFSRNIIRDAVQMWKFSISFQAIKIAYMIQQNIAAPVINSLFGPAVVTNYSITNRVPQSIFGNIARAVTSLFPVISEMHAKHERTKLHKVYLNISYLAVRTSLFCLTGMLVLNEWFVSLWVGPSKFAGFATLAVLSLIMAKDIFMNILGVFIYATSNFGAWPVLALLESGLAIMCSVWFGSLFGLPGVATGLILPTLLSNSYVVIKICAWLEISFWEYTHFISSAVIRSVPTLVCGATIYCMKLPPSWIHLIWSGLLLVCVNTATFELPRIIRSKEQSLKNKILVAFDMSSRIKQQ